MKYLVWIIIIVLVIAGIYYFISKDASDVEIVDETVTTEEVVDVNGEIVTENVDTDSEGVASSTASSTTESSL